MHRRELREHIFKLIFQIEFNDMSEMGAHVDLYLDDIEEAADEDREYIRNKFEAASKKVSDIDKILNDNTKGWKTSRMSKTDLAILRLALYEMTWDEDIPESVAINEAVELARKFGGEDSPSFVNGVLAKCITSIQ